MFLKCEKPITCHFRLSGIPLKKLPGKIPDKPTVGRTEPPE
jgi:hypothetical protein